MSIEFENKYLVVKREEYDKYLDPEEQRQLYHCLDGISEGRKWDGKNNNTYLVINTDESYAGEIAQIMKEHGHYTPGGEIMVAPPAKDLRGELDRYKQWVNDLQSGMYVNCVYCGHRYGPENKVPVSIADALKQHIEQCPEHPLKQYKLALNEVCADLACDDQCPHQEPDFEVWTECENCPGHLGEIHQDTERDIKCWERYYLDKAIAGLEQKED